MEEGQWGEAMLSYQSLNGAGARHAHAHSGNGGATMTTYRLPRYPPLSWRLLNSHQDYDNPYNI